jgi:hypothetical protein
MGGVDRTGRPAVFAFPAKHFSASRDMAEHKRTHLTFTRPDDLNSQ